jgi:8-amino-7-oxononanoate synthase
MHAALEPRLARIKPYGLTPHLHRSFAHNDLHVRSPSLCEPRAAFVAHRKGKNGVFVAVERVYGLVSTVTTFHAILGAMGKVRLFPACNAHLGVDKVHTMEIYGSGGAG